MADIPLINRAVKDAQTDPVAFHKDMEQLSSPQLDAKQRVENATAFLNELHKDPKSMQAFSKNRSEQEDVREMFSGVIGDRTNYVGASDDLKTLNKAVSENPEVKRILGNFHIDNRGQAEMSTDDISRHYDTNLSYARQTLSFKNGGINVVSRRTGGWEITEGGRTASERQTVKLDGKPLDEKTGTVDLSHGEAIYIKDGSGNLRYSVVADKNGRPTILTPDGKVVPYQYHQNSK